MDPAVAHQIWNYIGMLGVDRETARDLYQEAETAIWEAQAHRATRECHSYLVKTGIGAIRHWLRDRYSLIRIPGYLHDRGQAAGARLNEAPHDAEQLALAGVRVHAHQRPCRIGDTEEVEEQRQVVFEPFVAQQ